MRKVILTMNASIKVSLRAGHALRGSGAKAGSAGAPGARGDGRTSRWNAVPFAPAPGRPCN